VVGYKRFRGPCCLHLQIEVDFVPFISDCDIHSGGTAISSISHHVATNDGVDSSMRWSHGTV
jgi:hypothetical protein